MSLGWLSREEKKNIKDIDYAIMKLKGQQQSCYNRFQDLDVKIRNLKYKKSLINGREAKEPRFKRWRKKEK